MLSKSKQPSDIYHSIWNDTILISLTYIWRNIFHFIFHIIGISLYANFYSHVFFHMLIKFHMYVKLRVVYGTSFTCFSHSVTFHTFISLHFSHHKKFHMHFTYVSHSFHMVCHSSATTLEITDLSFSELRYSLSMLRIWH